MEHTRSFVLPSDTEKLSHKYILDAMRARRHDDAVAEIVAENAEEPVKAKKITPRVGEFLPLELPEGKKYFRIAQVSELVGVAAHVLRYWETEFTMIRPSKSGGQRVYRRKDVETLHLVRHLLHVEKMPIRAARKKVFEHRRARVAEAAAAPLEKTPEKRPTPAVPTTSPALLRELASELRDLVRLAQQT